jgi:hypothetical protein
MVSILFLFSSKLIPHGVSGIDYTKLFGEFNCGAGILNRNGTDRSLMDEIISHTDENNKEMRMRDYFGFGESSCCDVESGMNSLVQDSKVENCSSVPRACEERTVGTDTYSATDYSSEIRVGVSVKGENISWDPETVVKFHVKGENISWDPETVVNFHVSHESSSTEKQNQMGSAEQIQEAAFSNPNLQQLHISESEGIDHFHVGSSTLKSVEAFNTFQYWRVPVPELELDFSLAETDKPTAVQVKAEVTDETMRQTFASELNIDMEIDVSSFEMLFIIFGGCILSRLLL